MTAMTTTLARAMQAFCVIALMLSFAHAYAQTNTIESVNVSPQSGGRVLVRVTLKEPPANPPAGFTVNNPNAVAACGCGSSFRTADDGGAPKGCAH